MRKNSFGAVPLGFSYAPDWSVAGSHWHEDREKLQGLRRSSFLISLVSAGEFQKSSSLKFF
jgi:hypothetical protein